VSSVISVDPFRCRVWRLHDRLEEHITEESCRAEIQSFKKYGQLVPVLGRRLHEDPEHEIELIYGARRLFIARHTRKPLLIDVRDMSDLEGIVAMDMENRLRTDISPYERALSYMHWLRAGYFNSQEELARALQVSPSQVSRLLKLARLPSIVVDAFHCAVNICERWGLEIADILENSDKRKSVIQAARTIAAISPRPAPQEVYRQLLAAAVRGRKPQLRSHDVVVKGSGGGALFRIRQRSNSIALILPVDRVSATSLENIKTAVMDVLESSC
jgi:ParB family transcriptional regulator, chromosome partitioning protein